MDADGSSIEDVHVEGFNDGVVIGDTADARAKTLLNLTGGVSTGGPLLHVVHICNPSSPSSPCTSGSWSVEDVNIFQAQSLGDAQYPAVTIQDDLAPDTVNSASESGGDSYGNGPSVGLYAVGEDVTSAGYTRFTTGGSPFVANINGETPDSPTWGVGTAAPTSTSCPTGAIFSNQAGTGTTLAGYFWVCTGKSWSPL